MFKFLRLSKRVINPIHIQYIAAYEDCYKIYMASVHVDGFLIFGSGFIDSENTYFKVEKTNKDDYDSVTNWMQRNS